MGKIKNVLFLCSGNSCRSVFAEYYSKWLKETQYKSELKDVSFDSAGIRHYYEKPRDATIKYLDAKGVKLDDFIAKDITEKLINNNDLILGFEARYHTHKIKRRFKHIIGLDNKVYLLKEYAGEVNDLDIIDPIDLPLEQYNNVLRSIEENVDKVIEKIIRINEQENHNS